MNLSFISSSAAWRYTRGMVNSVHHKFSIRRRGLRRFAVVFAFAVAFWAAALGTPSEAYAACYNGSQARSIVAQNGLASLGRVVASYRGKGAQVTQAKLCSNGGGFVYRLTIVTRQGRVKRVSVNARTGR